MSAKKKVTNKPAKSKARAGKKKTSQKTGGKAKNAAQSKKRTSRVAFSRRRAAGGSKQSGDLQGISGRERADSESVDELLDEGNAFEAGIVSGVQEAEDTDEKEVHTREVLEDDVPDEYLDKDS